MRQADNQGKKRLGQKSQGQCGGRGAHLRISQTGGAQHDVIGAQILAQSVCALGDIFGSADILPRSRADWLLYRPWPDPTVTLGHLHPNSSCGRDQLNLFPGFMAMDHILERVLDLTG
jgi:hypothetical protein